MATRDPDDHRKRRLIRYAWPGLVALSLFLLPGIPRVARTPAGGTTCGALGLSYRPGRIGCAPGGTGISGVGAPPNGNWHLCLAAAEFQALVATEGWSSPLPGTIAGSAYWLLTLQGTNDSNLLLLGYQAIAGPCQGAIPPPDDPIIYQVYDQIAADAPVAFWSGSAACPSGESAADVCPPSVSNPLQVWVVQFVSPSGPVVCSRVLAFWYFTSYQACLMWQQNGSTAWWDFDDEDVNGQRIAGQNYKVPESGTGAGSAISHVYQYSSGYDPLRNCVRPCSGDMSGPLLPGWPHGAPAFQVTISSEWNVFLWECYSTTGGPCVGTNWRYVDLRSLGSLTSYFRASSLVPIPVVEYGASPP